MFHFQDYTDRNHKLVKAIIDNYGAKFFAGKTLLDLGCLHGDIASQFLRMGCDVYCLDARANNIEVVKKKHPGLKIIHADLDGTWPINNQFDIVLSLGLMCHIKNIEEHIRNLCLVGEYVILETEVLDTSDVAKSISVYEAKEISDLSYNGQGILCSARHIENKLSDAGAQFKRFDNNKINSGPYKYDWLEQNINERKIGNRRLWFIHNNRFIAQKLENQRVASINNTGLPPQKSMRSIRPRGYATHNISQPTAELSHVAASSTTPTPPVPPVSQAPATISSKHFTHIPKISENTANGVIRLFYNHYIDPNPIRQEEIDLCYNKNLDNALLQVITVESANNPTYEFFFNKINEITGPDDINIIANSDIFFDDTITLARNLKHKQVYALTCWDWRSENDCFFRNIQNSQDTWIVRGKVEGVFGNFQLGKWACDNRIAYEFHKAGYKVYNPSKTIKTYHVHNSGVRRHSASNGVPGPHLFVIPTALNNA